ncbi:tRNA wybutosine-synthesizing protein 5-like [Lineus longissimus]|uniref:tRNA wybutosine-synthesizing protein 5-like n=1 Tax=Lineus longissimus TaxID=88925 RepID=UPI002B4CB50D
MSAPIGEISIVENCTKDEFLTNLYPKRKPVILRGLDIGPCKDKWTVDYLSSKGGNKEVKLHVAPCAQMDFIHKNFAYRSLPFDEFIQRASQDVKAGYFFQKDERYYLRSLGDDPRKSVADIREQFPEIADDLKIPEFFDQEKFFSSVFRIGSAGVQLWTHYDVMDNILIQVKGRKRAVLYAPSDALYMHLNGDKSEVLDIDNPDFTKYPDFLKARRYECYLEPGDVLFIPALWFHNIIALEFSVAVNVFWKHLDNSCYDNKDTYGNKDPLAAGRAFQILDRALKTLDELPEEYCDFYARRLVARIQNKSFLNS